MENSYYKMRASPFLVSHDGTFRLKNTDFLWLVMIIIQILHFINIIFLKKKINKITLHNISIVWKARVRHITISYPRLFFFFLFLCFILFRCDRDIDGRITEMDIKQVMSWKEVCHKIIFFYSLVFPRRFDSSIFRKF